MFAEPDWWADRLCANQAGANQAGANQAGSQAGASLRPSQRESRTLCCSSRRTAPALPLGSVQSLIGGQASCAPNKLGLSARGGAGELWAGSVQRLTGAAVEESAHRQGPDWWAGKLGANQAGAHAKLPTSGQAGKAERSAGSQDGASLRPRLFTGACSVHTGSVPGQRSGVGPLARSVGR